MMNMTNIAFEVSPEEAQTLHDFLIANGVLCPGPRYIEKAGISRIIAVNRGTNEEVTRARKIVEMWRESKNFGD